MEFLKLLYSSLKTPSDEILWCEERLIGIIDLIHSSYHEPPNTAFLRDYIDETFVTIVNRIAGPESQIYPVIP